MIKQQLKREFRNMLLSNYQLRCRIASDIWSHDSTLKRWAINNNPKLTTPHFLKSFKKHAKISTDVELTETIDVSEPHLINA